MVSHPVPADLLQQVLHALQQEAARHLDTPPHICADGLHWQAVADPFSGNIGQHGTWRDARGQYLGCFYLNGDGSLLAEYDLMCPSSRQPTQFLEMVRVWGNAQQLRAEGVVMV